MSDTTQPQINWFTGIDTPDGRLEIWHLLPPEMLAQLKYFAAVGLGRSNIGTLPLTDEQRDELCKFVQRSLIIPRKDNGGWPLLRYSNSWCRAEAGLAWLHGWSDEALATVSKQIYEFNFDQPIPVMTKSKVEKGQKADDGSHSQKPDAKTSAPEGRIL